MADQHNPNFLDKNPIPRWQEAVAVIAAFIWTVLGWVGAMVWACTADVQPPKVGSTP